jgi:hypothetical protein
MDQKVKRLSTHPAVTPIVSFIQKTFSSTLNMERTGSSETLVTTYKAAGSNPEDHSLNHLLLCKEQNIGTGKIN